uniref:Uncharacterized protein n=1 Tax=viral metagenome TaxID=1070528 RepID=A0A6H1ZNG5_9ZZZZ
MIVEQTTSVRMSPGEKIIFWLKVSDWRRKIGLVKCHTFPDAYGGTAVIPAANEIEIFIESLMTQAYREGEEG